MIEGLMVLAYPGLRSRAYLQMMLAGDVAPEHVIIMGGATHDRRKTGWNDPHDRAFEADETIRRTIERGGLAHSQMDGLDVNDPRLVDAIARLAPRWAVFTGGGILRDEMLECGPRWIHVHPGFLPDYRGSTCHYYSLLAEGSVAASAFFMERGLDAGAILARRRFTPPAHLNPADLDHSFEAWLRGRVLVEALTELRHRGSLEGVPQDHGRGQMFYIIHPVLKNLAILSTQQHAMDLEVAGGVD